MGGDFATRLRGSDTITIDEKCTFHHESIRKEESNRRLSLPALLAALGEISIKHGHLDHLLKMMLRMFTGVRPQEAVDAESFPLTWPTGWKRTAAHQRTRAKFGKGVQQFNSEGQATWTRKTDLSIAQALERVMGELRTMGVELSKVIISTNLELRNDGLPRSGQRAPSDPGVSVYWNVRGQKHQRCMAIDHYDRVQDNLCGHTRR
jgi:hypothetical protein